MTPTDLQAAIDHVLRLRGVETPCETCHGLGTRMYPDTGTWRPKGGIVGRAFTRDVCDTCWGTGDAHRTGVNLWTMAEEEKERIAVAALNLYADKAGVGLSTMAPAVLLLVKELESLSKTRGKQRPPWFSLVCESLAKSLRDGVEAAKKREGK